VRQSLCLVVVGICIGSAVSIALTSAHAPARGLPWLTRHGHTTDIPITTLLGGACRVTSTVLCRPPDCREEVSPLSLRRRSFRVILLLGFQIIRLAL
jgi:hypothetical protein